MERQILAPGDLIIAHPVDAVAIRSRHEQAVQGRHQHAALDRKLEAARGEQTVEHRADTGPLPQPSEQQRPADPARCELGRPTLDPLQDDGAFGMPPDRRREPIEIARGQHRVLAAKVLDDALFGAAILAHALDQVEVGVAVDGLFTDEHGPQLAATYHARVK
jgi:hypothetical protein